MSVAHTTACFGGIRDTYDKDLPAWYALAPLCALLVVAAIIEVAGGPANITAQVAMGATILLGVIWAWRGSYQRHGLTQIPSSELLLRVSHAFITAQVLGCVVKITTSLVRAAAPERAFYTVLSPLTIATTGSYPFVVAGFLAILGLCTGLLAPRPLAAMAALGGSGSIISIVGPRLFLHSSHAITMTVPHTGDSVVFGKIVAITRGPEGNDIISFIPNTYHDTLDAQHVALWLSLSTIVVTLTWTLLCNDTTGLAGKLRKVENPDS